MLKNSIDIILLGEEFTLLPQKAIYYKKEKSLIIADIHIGKIGHFRDAGIPLPTELAFVDINMLDDLLFESSLNIEKLIVLGDLSHSDFNIDLKYFELWRNQRHKIEFQLVKGNHDILSKVYYDALGIEVFERIVTDKFLFIHGNRNRENSYELYKICGHVHPAVRMYGKAKQALTLPCYYFGERYGILPAFGRFTGRYLINPGENDNVFVITGGEEEKKVMKI